MKNFTFGDGKGHEMWDWDFSLARRRLPIKTGHVEWNVLPCLVTSDDDSDEYVTVDVECMYEHRMSNLWSIDTEIKITVQMINYGMIEKTMYLHFNSGALCFNFGRFITRRREMVDPDFEITSNIRIISSFGIQLFPILSFSTPQKQESEIELHLDYAKLYVEKHLFISCSPIFRKILLDGTNKIELKGEGVIWSDIEESLQILYRRNNKIINDRNVEPILYFARKYEIDCLVDECEDFLISTDDFLPIFRKLEIADWYKLSKLQEGILNKLADKRNNNIFGMSIETVKHLLRLHSTDEEDSEPPTKRPK